MSYKVRNTGALAAVVSMAPAAVTPATVESAAIDRENFGSCILFGSTGAVTGTPDAQSVTFSLTQSDTSAGDYTALTGSALAAITAIDTNGFKHIDLSGAKRFIKISRVVSLTAGTTPTIAVSGGVVLGGAVEGPPEADFVA